jgi:two-component system chemotaxis response regulator CheB
VLEAADGISFESGTAYVAAPDRHLRVGRGRITLDRGPKAQYTRPAIDPLFFSVPEQYEAAVVGVLLSGRGLDGVSGLVTIKQHGGVALVQHPSEAAFPSMPRSAIREDDVDGVLPLAKLADALSRLAEGASLQLNPPPRR